ncbi:MAG: hypothetical protein KDD62_14700 [Bdellovibrionales bacterium]|nr:hypothetical protein [Bdellovibrionales bacterium]
MSTGLLKNPQRRTTIEQEVTPTAELSTSNTVVMPSAERKQREVSTLAYGRIEAIRAATKVTAAEYQTLRKSISDGARALAQELHLARVAANEGDTAKSASPSSVTTLVKQLWQNMSQAGKALRGVINEFKGLSYQMSSDVPPEIRDASIPVSKQGELFPFYKLANNLKEQADSLESADGYLSLKREDGKFLDIIPLAKGKVAIFSNGRKLGNAYIDDAEKLARTWLSNVGTGEKIVITQKRYTDFVISNPYTKPT